MKNSMGKHHDIGNDLFTVMLDRQMNYSCAYWKQAGNLDAAQEAKLYLTCRKLMLKEGMRVLDIGRGWGGFAVYAVKNYGVEVVGIDAITSGRLCFPKKNVKVDMKPSGSLFL